MTVVGALNGDENGSLSVEWSGTTHHLQCGQVLRRIGSVSRVLNVQYRFVHREVPRSAVGILAVPVL